MITKWLMDNKWIDWVFSGIGVAAITLIISFFKKDKTNPSKIQKQKAGKNSTLIQVEGILNYLSFYKQPHKNWMNSTW